MTYSVRRGFGFFVFTFAITTTAVGSARAEKRSISDFWKETKLSFQEVDKLIDDNRCYRDGTQFQACVNALNTVLAYTASGQRLVPANETDLPPIKRVVAHYGEIKRVEFDEEKEKKQTQPQDLATIVAQSRARQKQRLVNWKDAYTRIRAEAVRTARFSFAELLRELEVNARKDSKEREPEIAAGAINAYMGTAFDPHTHIMPTAYVEQQYSQGDGGEVFYGIGAYVKMTDAGVVIEPMEGSPALNAGLYNGDLVTHVNGVSMVGKTIEEATRAIKGKEGTSVQLGVVRKNQSLQVSVVRGRVSQENLTTRTLTNTPHKMGYLRFRSFMKQDGCEDVFNAVRDLQSQGVDGLILDLRGNGGGLLYQSVCIANIFLDAGKVVVTQKTLPKYDDPKSAKTLAPRMTSLPLVVLINAGSASASEILSGALQDHKRALIVGDRSYGKGTVQSVVEMEDYPDVRKATTVARFYLPSGRSNQILGIVPDIQVDVRPNATFEDKFAEREEDLYTNALPPVSAPWVQPRPDYIASIESCRAKSGTALKTFEAEYETAALKPDYQRLVAQDVMECVLERKAEVLKGIFDINSLLP